MLLCVCFAICTFCLIIKYRVKLHNLPHMLGVEETALSCSKVMVISGRSKDSA